MSQLFAILITVSLMNVGINTYADDSVMRTDAMSNPAIEGGMMKVDMSSSLAKGDPPKSSMKKNKKHHKHKMKKNHKRNTNMIR